MIGRIASSMFLVVAALAVPVYAIDVTPLAQGSVGVGLKIDQCVIPGPELRARPADDRNAPLRLRVVATYPHGPDAFRYDLVAYGLEPGRHDLRNYLVKQDGSPANLIAPLPVLVTSLLPPGQIAPRELPGPESLGLGGYRLALIGGAILWLLGLITLLTLGRRRSAVRAATASSRPKSLAEHLRPLVEAARAGTLDPSRRAELERLLIGYWSRRLGLVDRHPAEALAELKRHDQAGPLLRQLEEWLHRPDADSRPVDIAALLAPYEALPIEDAADPIPEPVGAAR